MSHFSVLVIGPDVEAQLAPYHEFECTGTDDQYVQELDRTEEAKAEWEEHGEGRPFLQFIKDWYGSSVLRDGESRTEQHKFGYVVLEKDVVVKVVDRTNPNKKWDWWQIGGRWTGFFKVKTHALCGCLGEPGIQSIDENYIPPEADRADVCMKADIDIEGMRDEAASKADREYTQYHIVVDPHPPIVPWRKMVEKHNQNYDAAREEYHAQAGVKALNANRETIWFETDHFDCTREQYIERARNRALRTFAVVKGGQWYERGSMGWWGCVSDEKDDETWGRQFNELLDSLPDNTLLTVVDCHI